MILVREIFQLKFGKAKEAISLMKEGLAISKSFGFVPDRLLTDLAGPYYTLVMESTYQNLAEFEKSAQSEMVNEDFRKWYQKFVLLVDSGKREIFTIVP
jgi:hypothetical protein